jgi:hypothetical protein
MSNYGTRYVEICPNTLEGKKCPTQKDLINPC